MEKKQLSVKEFNFSVRRSLAILMVAFVLLSLLPTLPLKANPADQWTGQEVHLFRTEKRVQRDGVDIDPAANDPANDQSYQYTLTVEAYHTVTVHHVLITPYSSEVMEETVYDKVPHGKTFTEGTGQPASALEPKTMAALTNDPQYANYMLERSDYNYVHLNGFEFTPASTIVDDIEIIHTYEENTLGPMVDMDAQLVVDNTPDDFNTDPSATLNNTSTVTAEVWQSTSPWGTGAIKYNYTGPAQIFGMQDLINNTSVYFNDLPRQTVTGQPYYYQIRFTSQNLPPHYRMPQSSLWELATQNRSNIAFQWGDSFGTNTTFMLTPKLYRVRLRLRDKVTDWPVRQWPTTYYYPNIDDAGELMYDLRALHGTTFMVPSPEFDNFNYDPADLYGKQGEPAAGHTISDIQADTELVFTFEQDNLPATFVLDLRAQFEHFENSGLDTNTGSQNTENVLNGKAARFVVRQKRSDTGAVTETYVDVPIMGGMATTIETLPRYSGTGASRVYYTFQVAQAFVPGAELKNNGETCYSLAGAGTWFAPYRDTRHEEFVNSPITHQVYVSFMENAVSGIEPLPQSYIPNTFINAYGGDYEQNGVLLHGLRGGTVSISPPQILGTSSQSPTFTNNGGKVTGNLSTTFLYDLNNQGITVNADVYYPDPTYALTDDFGNNYPVPNAADVTLAAKLYRREGSGGSAVYTGFSQNVNFGASYLQEVQFSNQPRKSPDGVPYEYEIRISYAEVSIRPQVNGVDAVALNDTGWLSSNQAVDDGMLYLERSHGEIQRYYLSFDFMNGQSRVAQGAMTIYAGNKITGEPHTWAGANSLAMFNGWYNTTFISMALQDYNDTPITQDGTYKVLGLFIRMPHNARPDDTDRENPPAQEDASESLPPESEDPAAPDSESPASDESRSEAPQSEPYAPAEQLANDALTPVAGTPEWQVEASAQTAAAPPYAAHVSGAAVLPLARLDVTTIATFDTSGLFSAPLVFDVGTLLVFQGNERCYNFKKVNSNTFTFEMKNGGSLDIYYSNNMRTAELSSLPPNIPEFTFTIAENGQPYGQHTAQHFYYAPKTISGTNVPLSLSVPCTAGPQNSLFSTNLIPAASLLVVKHEADSESTRLPGVTFKLEQLKDGSLTLVKSTLVTDERGEIYLDKTLPEGDYILTETAGITGYEMLTAPVFFTVSVSQANSGGTVVVKVPNRKETPSSSSETSSTSSSSSSTSSSSSSTSSSSSSASSSPNTHPSPQPEDQSNPGNGASSHLYGTSSAVSTAQSRPSAAYGSSDSSGGGSIAPAGSGSGDGSPQLNNVDGFGVSDMWSLLSLVLSLLGVLSSITLMAHYILKRDKRPTTAAEDPDAPVARPSRWNVLRVTACGVGILLVVLFLVLENLALPMTWINMHTVWFLLLFLVQMTMVLVFALRGISLRKGNCSSPS